MNCSTCHRPVRQLDGAWVHDELAAILHCPAGVIEPEGAMFGVLTVDEAFILAHKLSGAAHAAHNVTEALAIGAGLFPIGGREEETLWASRARWVALSDECAGLAAECRGLRAALAVRMTADA